MRKKQVVQHLSFHLHFMACQNKYIELSCWDIPFFYADIELFFRFISKGKIKICKKCGKSSHMAGFKVYRDCFPSFSLFSVNIADALHFSTVLLNWETVYRNCSLSIYLSLSLSLSRSLSLSLSLSSAPFSLSLSLSLSVSLSLFLSFVRARALTLAFLISLAFLSLIIIYFENRK